MSSLSLHVSLKNNEIYDTRVNSNPIGSEPESNAVQEVWTTVIGSSEPSTSSSGTLLDPMQRNLIKAIHEHKEVINRKLTYLLESLRKERDQWREKNYNERINVLQEKYNDRSIATVEELTGGSCGESSEKKLFLDIYHGTAQGPRSSNEDAHFHCKIPQGELMGVFDGHCGSLVSSHANKVFAMKFSANLEETGNVRKAFEQTIFQIHQEVMYIGGGSTVVVSYIDHQNKIYTATLGDSETKIYRKIEGEMKAIPLSCVRDWLSPRDRALREYHAGPITDDRLLNNSKFVRMPDQEGLNVSRSIGDTIYLWHPMDNDKEKYPPSSTNPLLYSKEGVRRVIKPKITEAQLLPGDLIMMGCDGIFDFLDDTEILAVMNKNEYRVSLPREIMTAALRNMYYGGDNVTVMIAYVDDVDYTSDLLCHLI